MKKQNIKISKQEEIVYTGKAKIDNKDREIVRLLYKDSRLGFSDMAKEIGISRDAIRYRIERMVKNKVVQGFFPLINPPALGYPILTILQVKLQNFGPEKEKQFVAYAKNNRFVSNFAELTGTWDYLLVISSRDLGHLNEILKEFRDKFSDVIKEYETSNVLQTYKVSMYEGLV